MIIYILLFVTPNNIFQKFKTQFPADELTWWIKKQPLLIRLKFGFESEDCLLIKQLNFQRKSSSPESYLSNYIFLSRRKFIQQFDLLNLKSAKIPTSLQRCNNHIKIIHTIQDSGYCKSLTFFHEETWKPVPHDIWHIIHYPIIPLRNLCLYCPNNIWNI